MHAGVELACLDPAALSRDNLFDVGFDELLAGLSRLDRADAEPDGFFVVSGQEGGRDWRLNGQIFELGERVWRVDLRGECSFAAIEDVLRLLGWPRASVVFQPAGLGLTLEEDDFCRWMAQQR